MPIQSIMSITKAFKAECMPLYILFEVLCEVYALFNQSPRRTHALLYLNSHTDNAPCDKLKSQECFPVVIYQELPRFEENI